jgi:hypothetical protein
MSILKSFVNPAMDPIGMLKTGSDIYFLYSFIKRLSTPFKESPAFKLGIIDDKGKVLKKRRNLKTRDEKNAYTLMDTFIFNLKRIMSKVPFGGTRLASFAAALFLLKEARHESIMTVLTENGQIIAGKNVQMHDADVESRLEAKFTSFYNTLTDPTALGYDIGRHRDAVTTSTILENVQSFDEHSKDLLEQVDLPENYLRDMTKLGIDHVQAKAIISRAVGLGIDPLKIQTLLSMILPSILMTLEEVPANATGLAVAGTGSDNSTVIVRKKNKKISGITVSDITKQYKK